MPVYFPSMVVYFRHFYCDMTLLSRTMFLEFSADCQSIFPTPYHRRLFPYPLVECPPHISHIIYRILCKLLINPFPWLPTFSLVECPPNSSPYSPVFSADFQSALFPDLFASIETGAGYSGKPGGVGATIYYSEPLSNSRVYLTLAWFGYDSKMSYDSIMFY